MPWGAEDLSVTQRYKKTLEAGVNLYAGTADPAKLLETVTSRMVDMKLIDDSVFRLLVEKFTLGLFEDPYVDVAAAEKIVGNARFVERANLALRKSIVLLRNEAKALPLQARTRVYFETYQKQYGAPASGAGTVYTGEGQQYPVEFVHTPAEADVILLWIIPGARPLFASDGSPLLLSLSKCAVDVAYINKLTAQKPTILALNYTNPWVIDEIYNKDLQGHFKGVLATFGTTPEALLDVVTGKFKPGGRMPFTTPVSEAAAQNQKEDVPGYLEGPGYALFRYDEGLSYR
jgi:beta-glucosidase